MRVAYFAETFPSASETWVHHEIQELKHLGCQIRVFSSWQRPERNAADFAELPSLTRYLDEIPASHLLSGLATICRPRLFLPLLRAVLRTPPTARHAAQLVRDLIRMARFHQAVMDFKPDIVICHFAGTRANLGLFLRLLDGTPYLVKSHAKDIFVRSLFLSTKVATASKFYTISHYNLRFIADHYPSIDRRRIHLHACGIPLDTFPFGGLRRRLPDERSMLLSVGRLVPMKGFQYLIRTAKILKDLGRDHRFVIVGEGPDEERLEQLIRKLHLEDSVHLVGYRTPEEIRLYLRDATAFVMPCVWDDVEGSQDGIPVALIESMACGIPVISTRLSGIPELIEDGVSGFLASPGDSQELATVIEKVLSMNYANLAEISTRARQAVELNHDIRKLTRDLHVDLQEILGAPSVK